MNITTEPPRKVLSRVFGYQKFRPHQEEVAEALLKGRDVFALMPTGGGKSICYQLPGVMMDSCVVVVSPLIALMKDQVDAARANGIRAACVNSTQPLAARREAARAYRAGDLDLLYLAPERLAVDGFFDRLRECPSGQPGAFAIDEAHCLSEWGHDFRPDYLVLARLRESFPRVPIGAFTATATERVREDILARLQLREPTVVRASFDRSNLFYEVRTKQDLEGQLVEFLRERPGESGIIYRTTRKSVMETVDLLRRNGIEAHGYHAGMDDSERVTAQEAFIRDDCPVMVATIAFGMGIDKSDVRFVVHADLPKNLESYYQETGRAGRDGEPSHCLLLYSGGDAGRHRYFIDQIADPDERERALGLLQRMERFASVPACRRRAVLDYFGENYPAQNCGSCDVCNGNYARIDATADAKLLLSVIQETDGRFGAVHLCEVVTGAATARVRSKGHDRLRSYGGGKDKPKAYWRRLLDAMLADNLLRRSDEAFPVPTITALGRRLSEGEGRFDLLEDQRPDSQAASSATTVAEEPYHAGLYEQLRTLRKEIADQESVPPYVVFSDRSLRSMAGRMPESTEGFSAVHGVGDAKLKKYGTSFLTAIRDFVRQHPDAPAERVAAPAATVKRTRSATCTATLELLQAGKSPEEIAVARNLSVGTIYSHLERLLTEGENLDWRPWVPEEVESVLRDAFATLGTKSLTPVIEAANEAATYEQAKIMRAVLTLDRGSSAPLSIRTSTIASPA